MKIQGKSALVTGVSSGLGAARVRRLAAGDAYGKSADLNDQGGAALAKELGPSVDFIKTDVTHEKQIADAVQQAVTRANGLHILVTTAGVGVAEKVLGKNGMHDLQKFAKVIQINLIGTFDAARQAASLMAGNQPDEDGGRGVIIMTASIAAFEGQIGQAAYSPSKGGVPPLPLPLPPHPPPQG